MYHTLVKEIDLMYITRAYPKLAFVLANIPLCLIYNYIMITIKT